MTMITKRMRRTSQCAILLGTLLTFTLNSVTNAVAVAVEPLSAEMGVLADQVAQVVKKRNEKSVTIGAFVLSKSQSPAKSGEPIDSSAGAGIALALADELASRGIGIKKQSVFLVQGSYSPVIDSESKLLALEVTGQVLERASGDVAGTFGTKKIVATIRRGIVDPQSAGRIGGVNFDIPPDATLKQQTAIIAPLLDTDPPVSDTPPQSPFFPDGNVLRTKSESPFGLEVLVQKDGQFVSLPITDDDGQPFVAIARDEIYAIRVVNDAPYDVAVTLRIDGINIFEFGDHKQDYSYFIIGGGKSAVIKGWHRTNKVSDSFLVTEYSRSPAAKVLQPESRVGLITAEFKAAWRTGQPPPSDESASWRGELTLSKSADATGFGPQTDAEYGVAQRIVGKLRTNLAIRYSR
jgi:hypothetical protein